MIYGQKADTVRRILLEGPTTSPELAATLEWGKSLAAAWLNALVKQGHVVTDGTIARDKALKLHRVDRHTPPKTTRKNLKLYRLTERGIAACRNHQLDTMRAQEHQDFPDNPAKVISKANGLSTRADRTGRIGLGETPWLNTHSYTWPEG